MSYKLGRMGIAEGIGLIAFVVIVRFFFANTSNAIDVGAGLTWLAYVISTVAAFCAGAALLFMQRHFQGDLLDVAKILLGSKCFYAIGMVYAAIFFLNALLLIRMLSENILQIELRSAAVDIDSVILLHTIVTGAVIYFGIEALARAMYLILPFIFLWMTYVFLIVIPACNIYNLAPWLGTGLGKVVHQGLVNSGVNVGVHIIAILAPAFQNFETRIKGLLWGMTTASFLKIVGVTIFVMAVGVEVGREKMIPFYEIASIAYIEKTFQRLDSTTVFLCVATGIGTAGTSLYVSLYLLSRMLDLPSMRPVIPLFAVIIYHIAGIFRNIIEVVKLDLQIVQSFFNVGLYLIPGILLASFLFKRKRILNGRANTAKTNE